MRVVVLVMSLLCAGEAAAEKVFVAALAAGAGADPAEVLLVDERLLSSLRRVKTLDVVGARDVATMMDVEAARQQAGCSDGIACAAEVAGALDAPTVITGHLGRVGRTWVLSLSRLDQRSLQVVARVTRESQGVGPDAVFASLDSQVDELFGRGPDPWAVGGGVVVGVGAAGLLAAGGLGAGAWALYLDTEQKLRASTDVAAATTLRANARGLGEGLNIGAIAVGVFGVVGVIAGGTMLTMSAMGGAE